MERRNSLRIVGILVGLLLGILVTGTVYGIRTAHPYQVAEADGRRQREFRFFGFVPYEAVSPDPTIQVTGDFFREITKAGIRLPTEFNPKMPRDFLARHLRKSETEYYLRVNLKLDPVKVIAGIKPQLGQAKEFLVPGGSRSLEGRCADGHHSLRMEIHPGVRVGEHQYIIHLSGPPPRTLE